MLMSAFGPKRTLQSQAQCPLLGVKWKSCGYRRIEFFDFIFSIKIRTTVRIIGMCESSFWKRDANLRPDGIFGNDSCLPDLSSGLKARENAFQCLHCFLFIQFL